MAPVLKTFFPAESAQAIISRVVVFPTEPVTPTVRAETWLLAALPICCRAFTVSFTRITEVPFFEAASIQADAASSSDESTQDAPFSMADKRKRCPSMVSPMTGTNKDPGHAVLESVVSFVRSTSFPSKRRVPPQAERTSVSVSFIKGLPIL